MKSAQLTGKVFLLLFIAFLFGFKSPANVLNSLLGKWTMAGLEAKGCADANNNFKNTCPQKCLTVTFEANGNYTFENGLGDPASGKGKYTVEGNTISVTVNGGISPNSTFKADGNTLYISVKDPTTKCEYIETFKN